MGAPPVDPPVDPPADPPHDPPEPAGRDPASHLALIAEMTRAVTASGDLEQTLAQGLWRIAAHLEAEAGSLFLLDRGDLVCAACSGPVDITGLRVPADRGIIGRTIRQRRTLRIRDVRRDPDFNHAVDRDSGFVTRSILAAAFAAAPPRR